MKHTGPSNSVLRYKIFPGGAGIEVGWGGDWVVWCNKNCEGKFAHDCITKPNFKTFFLFENKADAFRFKVVWG